MSMSQLPPIRMNRRQRKSLHGLTTSWPGEIKVTQPQGHFYLNVERCADGARWRIEFDGTTTKHGSYA